MYSSKTYNAKGLEFTFIEVSTAQMKVTLMDYGATIMSVFTPDKFGKKELVVMAYDTLDAYVENNTYLNATIGPFSGRISNATYTLDGKEYHIDQNHLDTENLHGGSETFAFRFFDYDIKEEEDKTIVTFSLENPESDFPGKQTIKVIYTIFDSTIQIDYQAKTDKDTLLNMTNHAYFNLSGDLKHTILDHDLYINSSKALTLNDKFSPIGVESSLGTHLDFTKKKPVKDNFYDGIYDRNEKGIDNPLLLDQQGLSIKQVELSDPVSKRRLRVYTTYPCVVCYTHNHINDLPLLFHEDHPKHMGICFEMQYEPNGINVEGLHDSILKKGDTYKETIVFEFGIEED
jgi:aldose 1-epimerase